jgi:hypothetical protein
MGMLGRRLIVGMRSGAAVFLLVGGWALYAAASAPSASASGLGGTATIADPTSNQPIASGGSATVFTVLLTPAPADCSGDTATDGYHVYSYLLPEATAVTSDNFALGSPSEGLGFVDGSGYYGPVNTAPTTGQILTLPADFAWSFLLSLGETAAQLDGGSSAVWNAGILCANSAGTVTDNWNTQVTFTKSTSDSNGFTWSAVAGTPGGTTTTTTTTTTTQPTTGNATTTSPTTTTITPSGGATTTTAAGSTASGSSGSSGSTGSSGGDGSGTPTSSGSLAFTGAFITRSLAIGLLCIGFGLILLGLSVKVRRDIAPRVVLR